MKRADSLLGPLLRSLGIEEGASLARIRSLWFRIFSEPLSSHMYPSRLSGGVLIINVDSPVWMHQLAFCKKDIVEKLRSFGVRDVRLRIGRLGAKKPEPHTPPEYEHLQAEDERFIDELVSEVDDEVLKSSIRSAAVRSMKRVKKPRTSTGQGT